MRRIVREGWRQLCVLVAVLMAFSFLAHSLFAMQVQKTGYGQVDMAQLYLQDVAAPQVQPPVRGIVVDTHGQPLVGTITVYKLAAWPPYVQNPQIAARLLAPILFPQDATGGAALRADMKALAEQLGAKRSYVCLAGTDSATCPAQAELSESAKRQVQALNLTGLTLEPRSLPSYPNGSLAAHLLGYVAYQYQHGQVVDAGQYGVERYYNNLLRGIPGTIAPRADAGGNRGHAGGIDDPATEQGATVTLTLDSYVQLMIEQQLNQVVTAQHAESGTIIVERPDGAILGWASTPAYDPQQWESTYQSNGNQLFIDPAISGLYEPGSTFKAFTVAIGLDSHSFSEYTPIFDNGILTTDGITIQNWCQGCSFSGRETVRDMLHYSSNIGATEFSKYIPTKTFYEYLDRFGFNKPTGIDLAGEIGGSYMPLDNLRWVPAYKDTIAYGQGIAITPLQVVNGYAAFAGNGALPRPYIMQSYTLNGRTYVVHPQRLRQVISPATATMVRHILVDSAAGGEACEALVPGYDVAAKTGTASIPEYSSYAQHQTIASTAAFAPAFAPQFVVLVIVHKPNVQWGSLVAAPVVHTILQNLFNYYHVQPDPNATQPSTVCASPG